jgi:hypothetical protein
MAFTDTQNSKLPYTQAWTVFTVWRAGDGYLSLME